MEPITTHTGIGAPLRRSNVDTDQIIGGFLVGRTDVVMAFEGKQRRSLGQSFDDQHPGHDGIMREVPLKKRFVQRHILDGNNTFPL